MTNEEGSKGNIILSIIAIVVSIFALVVSIWGPINDIIIPGDTIPLTPAGFSIVRGSPNFVFPSDHIVLPLEWYNSWKEKTEIISLPYLVLRKLGSNETHIFFLAGEYPDISAKSFKESYTIERTFIFPPSTLSKRTLVFRIEKWWDHASMNYEFKFKPRDKYDVSIGFQQWDNGKFIQHPEVPLFTMPILDTVGNLSYSRDKYWWDTFDLNRTTGFLW